jgi:DNA-binding response OmpR family regulator
MRLLVVEDQEKLALSLKKGLESIGYAVDILSSGERALDRIIHQHENYDCVLLDRMLPEIDGASICMQVRGKNINIPIIILTALDEVSDRVEGLDIGADDYITKPFSFIELASRIKAILRRPKTVVKELINLGNISIDVNNKTVKKNSRDILLTTKEFAILEYLMRNPNQVLTREQIMNHVWDYSFDSFSNVVDVHIKNLRKKLQNKNEKIFETIHGIGYKFIA